MTQTNLQLFREIDALRFYSGDIRERCNDGRLGSEFVGGLYSDRDAYRTLNALLFPGVENEKERIWQEGHKLNPDFIDEIEKTVQIYTDIFTLMKDKRQNNIESVIGKRVDRVSSVDYYLKNGFTQSYFSCSKAGYDSEFGKNKLNIALFEVEFSTDTPCVDFESILPEGEYKFSDEKEILLPPFLSVSCETVQMTHSEKKIRDKEGKSPMGKYRLKAGTFPDYRKNISVPQSVLWQDIMDGKVFAAELLKRLNRDNEERDYAKYTAWKGKLQAYLKVQFSDIWYGEDRN